MLTILVCSDKNIVAQAPNMLQRCMSILIESKQTWPLASRWLESLERFSRDPKAAAFSLEGSMADGVSSNPCYQPNSAREGRS